MEKNDQILKHKLSMLQLHFQFEDSLYVKEMKKGIQFVLSDQDNNTFFIFLNFAPYCAAFELLFVCLNGHLPGGRKVGIPQLGIFPHIQCWR